MSGPKLPARWRGVPRFEEDVDARIEADQARRQRARAHHSSPEAIVAEVIDTTILEAIMQRQQLDGSYWS